MTLPVTYDVSSCFSEFSLLSYLCWGRLRLPRGRRRSRYPQVWWMPISDAGESLFLESDARQAYFPLAANFLTQKYQSYCGIASVVMVLNALQLSRTCSPGVRALSHIHPRQYARRTHRRVLPRSSNIRPYWVTASDLFNAMNTPDADNENKTRGYVLIAKPIIH